MSSALLIRSARRAVAAARPVASTSRAAAAQSRLYSSTVNDNDPDVLESEKAKNLSGKQHKSSSPHKNAPGWNEYLATTSEAAVKADKSENGGPEMMQKRSIEMIKARHHADDVTSGTVEAEYEREEVEGPLKSALSRVKETVETVETTVKTKVKSGTT